MERVKSGDENARREFVICNMRLVLSVVQRYTNRRESMDDIFQVGCIGLLKSIDNFDTSIGVKFSTYAVPMIIGEIRRFLRDNNSLRVSRSLRDTAYQALQARERLERVGQNETTIDQIAAELSMPMREVAYALDAISDPVSLFDPIYHDGTDAVLVMDQISDLKNVDENWLENVALKDGMSRLSRREKEILLLRYYEGRTQMEVSEEVGISQAQVSRLEKNAIGHIRKFM
jgi:RNA polymerase sporulation-specific sigma factor